MFRTLLPFLVVGLIGFGIYQFLQAPTPAAEAPVTPEAEFQDLLSLNQVSAEQIGSLCDRFPQLARQVLRNRPLKISGTIEDIFVTGLDGRRAVFTLGQSDQRQIDVVLDMDKYAMLGLDPIGDRRIRYVLVGTELLKVTPPGIYREGSHRYHVTEEVRRLVATRFQTFEETVTFDRMTPDAIILKAAAK